MARCFHGVFAPNSQYRAQVTPAKRGRGNKAKTPAVAGTLVKVIFNAGAVKQVKLED